MIESQGVVKTMPAGTWKLDKTAKGIPFVSNEKGEKKWAVSFFQASKEEAAQAEAGLGDLPDLDGPGGEPAKPGTAAPATPPGPHGAGQIVCGTRSVMGFVGQGYSIQHYYPSRCRTVHTDHMLLERTGNPSRKLLKTYPTTYRRKTLNHYRKQFAEIGVSMLSRIPIHCQMISLSVPLIFRACQ